MGKIFCIMGKSGSGKDTILKEINKVEDLNLKTIVTYPPGVPMLIMGEIIEERHVKLLNEYMKNKVDLIGVKDKKVKVIKNK